MQAFETKAECIAILARSTGDPNRSGITQNGKVVASYKCLPDAVDPRGPKGK